MHNSSRTTSQVGCKSPLSAMSLLITPACLDTFGRVYWVLSMVHIHRTPHLDHMVLLLVISSSHSSVRLSTLTIYLYIKYSIHHVLNSSLHLVSLEISILCSDDYTCFYACSFMFYISFNLSYVLSNFKVLTHTCATSSHDVGSILSI